MNSLYLHIPFCQKKCFYCSFATAINQQHYIDEYIRCLSREMRLYEGAEIGSVYFGGGTPSILDEEHFLFLVGHIKKFFIIANDAEFTIEMNPEDVIVPKLRCYQNAGVTRLSLGVQAFADQYLKFLGRCHNARQAVDACRLIRERGFSNVNIDLMYGFPGQAQKEIAEDLNVLRELSCEHVSLYTLTVEEGSRFFRDKVILPDAEFMAEYYFFVRDQVMAMGLAQYEVSNFARPGMRALHNMNYWRGGNYIGLGMAAHSHQNGQRWWNVSRLRTYIEKIRLEGSAKEGQEKLTLDQRLGESLVFGLRMLDGVDMVTLQKKFGSLSAEQNKNINRFVSEGMLKWEKERLKVTAKGLLVLDEISVRLI